MFRFSQLGSVRTDRRLWEVGKNSALAANEASPNGLTSSPLPHEDTVMPCNLFFWGKIFFFCLLKGVTNAVYSRRKRGAHVLITR